MAAVAPATTWRLREVSGPEPMTPEERTGIHTGEWFQSLSSQLRHDILRNALVRRYSHGEVIARRGERADHWLACARGAVEIGTSTRHGKQHTLAYLQPGAWFGDIGLVDGGASTHDAAAHGPTSVLCVGRDIFEGLLVEHVELVNALVRLNARRLRHMFAALDEAVSLPVRARVCRQLLRLIRAYGEYPDDIEVPAVRIGLRLHQEQLARLAGCSRQRANMELKALERANIVWMTPAGLIVRDEHALTNYAARYDVR